MKHFAVAALLVTTIYAHADVVYNWQTVDAKGATSDLYGKLVVTDDAWRAGSLDYYFSPGDPWNFDPTSPVLQFSMGSSSRPEFNHFYRIGGFPDAQSSYVRVTFGDELDGEMGSAGSFAYVDSSSSAGIWTLTRLFSYPYGGINGSNAGCWVDICEGFTGRWVLDQTTVPVSIPGTLALTALGLSLLAMRPRRGRAFS